MTSWNETNAIRNFALPGAVAFLLSGGSLTHISSLTALAAVGIGVDRATSKDGFKEMGKSRFGALGFGLGLPILIASGKALLKSTDLTGRIGFGITGGLGAVGAGALLFLYKEAEPVIRSIHYALPALIAAQAWLPHAAGSAVGGIAALALAKISADEEHEIDLGALVTGMATLGIIQSAASIIQGNHYCWGGALINAGVLAGLSISTLPGWEAIETEIGGVRPLLQLFTPALLAYAQMKLESSPLHRVWIASAISLAGIFTPWHEPIALGAAVAALPSALKGVCDGPSWGMRIQYYLNLMVGVGTLFASIALTSSAFTAERDIETQVPPVCCWLPVISYALYSALDQKSCLIGHALVAWSLVGASRQHDHEVGLRTPANAVALTTLIPSLLLLRKGGSWHYGVAALLSAAIPLWTSYVSVARIRENL